MHVAVADITMGGLNGLLACGIGAKSSVVG